MITGLTLPFRFDVARLQADLAFVRDDEWRPHFNENDYGGQWRGVALTSIGGASGALMSPPSASPAEFLATDVLQRCAYFREVLAAFPCPLKSVRLLGLAPGSRVREHCDRDLGYEHGEMRIHVPVQTSDGLEFYLGGERLRLEEGGCYYLNVSLPHRIRNGGSHERVHLVIDVVVDDWAHAIIKESKPIPRLPHCPLGFEDFRLHILRDNALAERLHAGESPADVGRELGYEFEASAIGSSLFTENSGLDLRGWVPVSVAIRDEEPVAEWAYFGKHRFTEPFFEQSIRQELQNPFTRAFRFRAPLRKSANARQPDGFIFHMSRCGSTLISRALSALPRVVAVSEAPAIDTLIQTGRADWLRALILALGKPREGSEDPYVVKFDSWHIHKLAVVRAAFPDTPWIFLHRDPLEVLVSQIRSPGMQALPGAMDPAVLGMTLADVIERNPEKWCAKVLAGFLRSALDHRDDPKGLFLNYRDLPEAIWGSVAEHFDLAFSDDELALLRQAVQFSAKLPQMSFTGDTEEKQRAITPEMRALAAEWLDPLYRRFE